ncbi:MAG: hypothetical protein ONB23_01540 [candidate division KSB1 bacterium]|nr:hypothetical protein [candidate division KSB1 bacterium]
MIRGEEIYQLLRKVVTGTYTERDLVQAVDLFQKISLSYLRYLQVYGRRVGGDEPNLVTELENVALDCIAPLFRRDRQGRFVILRAYFGEELKGYDPERPLEILADLRRLVVKKTKQELARIFRERDPEGARLLRNIRVAVRSSDDLHLFREGGRDWLCWRRCAVAELERELAAITQAEDVGETSESEGLRRGLPVVPEAELRTRFLAVHQANDPVPVSLRKMLQIVQELPQYQNCIPVEMAAKVIREIHARLLHHHIQLGAQPRTPFEHVQNREIEQVVAEIEALLWEKLKRYVWRRKLSPPTAEAYRYALKDVLHDELDRFQRVSYFHQLKHYLPGLEYAEYRERHRSVFEYLAKVGRRELARRLRTLI